MGVTNIFVSVLLLIVIGKCLTFNVRSSVIHLLVLVSNVRSDLKGSTCQCHYCKCERGNLYCLPHHKGFSTFSNGFLDEMSKSIDKLFGLITKKNKGEVYSNVSGHWSHIHSANLR